MKKRYLIKVLPLVFTLCTLYGCSQQSNHTSSETTKENITLTATPTTPILPENDDFSTEYLLTVDSTSSYVISDLLYGLFLEDINFSIDGGLYAEMIKNRSFEYDSMAKGENLHGWTYDQELHCQVVDGTTDQSWLNQNNPTYLHLVNQTNSTLSLNNSGFLDGMTIVNEETYHFSGYFRSKDNITSLEVKLIDKAGNTLASTYLPEITEEFQKIEVDLISSQDGVASDGITCSLILGKGSVDIDMISLFPDDTYQGRTNGLRKDLAQALEELSPSFLRFPGGCVVEGETLENAYSWKDSIGNGLPFEINGVTTYGDVATRPLAENIWGDQNSATNHPYYMTYGLGFYEYFLLCEDLACEPIPIVNAGMSCLIQGTRKIGTPADVLPIESEEMKQYIQDALDLVEFCKGDKTTYWGSIRISMGHEEPFPLTYIGIGNEQWGYDYFEHYEQFVKAFDEAAKENPALYQDIKLIVANGPTATDTYAWNKIKLYGKDYAGLVDEHYYMEPAWFLNNANRYDLYDRTSVPVFLGEYAAKSNNLEAALAEAAFMTGLERNGDIVQLASYAPLFGNSISYQWKPDLLWFKSGINWKSVNYYVQQMFSQNAVHKILNSSLVTKEPIKSIESTAKNPVSTSISQEHYINNVLYQVCGVDKDDTLVIKLVNVLEEPADLTIRIPGYKETTATLTTLTSDSLTDINTLANPTLLSPKEESIKVSEDFTYTIPKNCVAILRIPQK